MPASNPSPEIECFPQEVVPGKIGVVTVTYNSASVLPEFLSSLHAQTYDNVAVFVVDNASQDTTLEDLKRLGNPRFRFIENKENRGVAAANNQGILAAIAEQCEFVLLLNNDVAFGPDLFATLVGGLNCYSCEMTAPFMYYHDRPNIIWAAGGTYQPIFGFRCFHLKEGDPDDGQPISAYRVPHAPTCCVLFKRDVFHKIGLMDERYFVYHDDTDFMLRTYHAGMRLFCLPEAKLWHKVSSLTGAESDFSIRYGTRNRALMIVKFMGRLLAVPYRLLYRLIYFLRFLSGRDDRHVLRLKLSSWREGERIPTNWLPYRYSRSLHG